MSSEYTPAHIPFPNLYLYLYPGRHTAWSWLQRGVPVRYEDDQYVSTDDFVAIAKHSIHSMCISV